MPIKRLAGFSPAGDLHVLRGAPPILLPKLLQVEWGEGDAAKSGSLEEYNNAHGPVTDVVVEFRPTFPYPPNQPNFENFKIRITRGSGELHVLAGPVPEPKPHNFIIEATLTFNGGAPQPKERIARLRVHAHESVTRLSVTPVRMSIPRPTATGEAKPFFQFTVRAEFDDGSAADITETAHYAVDPADADFVDASLGSPWIRLPAGFGAGSVRTLTFRTTPAWNSRTAHADIAVLDPWETATNVPKASLVDGHPGVWDGTIKPERVPNVLFLGIGFRPLDLQAFEDFSNTLAHRLKTDRHLTPYRYLATSMNFWRLFVPAPEAGVSVRCEVFSFLRDGRRFALPVPAATPPPQTGPWKLRHLVYVAGLPVATDLNFVKEEGHTQPPSSLDDFNALEPDRIDFSLLLGKWATTMLPTYVQALPVVTPVVLKAWVSLASRTFIDEVDNFPNVAIGEPPSVKPDFDDSAPLEFYFRRGGAAGVEPHRGRSAFFRRVVAEPRNGGVIALEDFDSRPTELGNLWAEDRSNFAFDNHQLVVALCNMPIGRSERFFGRSNWKFNEGLFSRPTLKSATPAFDLAGLPVAETSGQRALRLDLPPLASLEPLSETWEVLAHELSHAFGLGDEYTESVPVPWGFGPGLPYPNLTSTDLVLNPDRSVLINNIKWNWHRVRNASVITRPVVDMFDGNFRVIVARGGGFQFKPGDDVRLRQRVPRTPLGADPLTSIVEFVVQSIHPNNLEDAQDALNMTIVIRNESIGIDVAPFGPGSVIYAPVPAPDSVRSLIRPYLTMVSPAAERIMAAIGGTMSGKDCDTSNMEWFRANVQIPRIPINQLSDFAPLSRMTTMVGVYYGGAQDACGVVHPAGSCIMRSGADHYTVFCPVCRFALIDLIDPEQHWRNDRDYDAEYTL